ncbi:MAG: glycosyl hydrolase, partial [Myxococcota bacterium]
WVAEHPRAARRLVFGQALAGDARAGDSARPTRAAARERAAALASADDPGPIRPAPRVEIGPDGLPTRFHLGINEAVSVPMKARNEGRLGPGGLEGHLRRDAQRAVDLGARFVRGNSGAFPRTSWWSHQNEPGAAADTDTWVRVVQEYGLEPILMVSPWPGNRTANHTERYVPDDMAAYTAWVSALVERYDHDGVDDMPGLAAPIRYWEVDNEPDLKFTTAPRDAVREVAPGSFCSPAEAAKVLVATSAAIRKSHAEAQILNGGIYRPFAESGQDYLRELLAQPGVPTSFDILSLHTYASDEFGDFYARGLRAARELAGGKPIFVTETSVASEGERRWMTPEWQARMVASAAARGAAAGARVVLWHTLADPPSDSRLRSGFERHSLLSQGAEGRFVEKPAAAVYRHLSERISANDLTGAHDDGVGAARTQAGAFLVYANSREAPKGGINLMDGSQILPETTAVAPAWIWP